MAEVLHDLASQGFQDMFSRASHETGLSYIIKDGASIMCKSDVEINGTVFPLWYTRWPLKTLNQRVEEFKKMK